MMKYIPLVFLSLLTNLFSDVKSLTGQIEFKVNIEQPSNMILSEIGLGVGVNPTANLHVNGNALISESIHIGGITGNSNININGTLGYGVQSVSSNAVLGDYSVIFADTSNDNIILTLPTASSSTGKILNVKKTSELNQLWISASDNIETYDSQVELTSFNGGYPYIEFISTGSQWIILNSSEDVFNVVGADNLIAWWKLDENSGATIAKDSSIHSNDGTYTNITSSNIGIDGVVDQALSVDGVDDFVIADFIPIYDVDDFSVSFWIKTNGNWGTDGNDGSDRALVFTIANDDFDGLTFRQNYTGELLSLGFDASGQVLNGGASGNIADGIWHHIFLNSSSKSGEDYSYYVDGALIRTNTLARDLVLSGNVIIADGPTIFSEEWLGEIDDIRFYNRKLEDLEIQHLYQLSR